MHINGLVLISKFTLFLFILAMNHCRDLNGEPATVFWFPFIRMAAARLTF